MQAPINILSGQHRDKWAEHHAYLFELDGKNAEAFRAIETALFAVSLDHRIVPSTVADFASLIKIIYHQKMCFMGTMDITDGLTNHFPSWL
jgi:hypothetical protein